MSERELLRLKQWVKQRATVDAEIRIDCFPYGIREVADESIDIAADANVAAKIFGYEIAASVAGIIAVFLFSRIFAPAYQMVILILLLYGLAFLIVCLHRYLGKTIWLSETLKPQQIVLSDQGITFVVRLSDRQGGLLARGQSRAHIPWRSLVSISLRNSSSKNFMDLVLRFDTRESRYFDLKLSAIFTRENWATIARVTEAYAPHVAIDGQIGGALAISSTNTSYTELWLESLSKPPSDQSFVPLEDELALLDGRYIIKTKLASGGQGHVYEAVEQRTGQAVVLKEYLLPIYVDEAARKRALAQFESEVSILKQLSHPKIVKLIDYFAESNRAFLVLNRIHGVSLKEFVRKKGPLASSLVLELLKQMCDILGYLHERSPSVVHRDFTPDNLLIDEGMNITLIDFTIAQTAQGAPEAPAGKVAYMPPEQYRGEVLPQSDIYAMAATIYYCLTGTEPEALRQLTLVNSQADIPQPLCDFVYQSTAQEMESRPQSAAIISRSLSGLSSPIDVNR